MLSDRVPPIGISFIIFIVPAATIILNVFEDSIITAFIYRVKLVMLL